MCPLQNGCGLHKIAPLGLALSDGEKGVLLSLRLGGIEGLLRLEELSTIIPGDTPAGTSELGHVGFGPTVFRCTKVLILYH